MGNADCVRIREQLVSFPGTKLGFMIYRLTYKDDDKWNRFMAYFKSVVHGGLERSGDGDLIPYIDWDVYEDPAMEDADSDAVRAHFRQRLEETVTLRLIDCTLKGKKALEIPSVASIPRHMACLAINEGHIDQCLRDAEPKDTSVEWGSVNLVRLISSEEARDEEEEKEGESEGEEDYDSAIVDLSEVFPRVYSLLGGYGWDVNWYGGFKS